ncbi:16S rRNA pseudouridine(516) synthase [Cupriavidus sp. SZY C1]|uniref:pseudouridine synthase n=1 Tax=Cupriavidus sp. SZY C1 TaxID=3055037 RepID=UPI0028B3DE43|nr:16S rRNA pseudouridine(516) synthase [Cupriavidus sp. SZY C1]MDT6960375.1 16S rRNA pseudouridine(516) synthase [Cupriavidus sp. SZY C1]
MATTLDRILQSQGFGTRRYCGDLVEAGLVEVNGELCEDPGARFEVDGLRLTVDGEEWLACTKAYLMLHKPTGYECSQKPRHHPSVYNLLPVPLRQREVQAVGRLDHDTTGLLLLTDDGQFIHAQTSPKKQVPKVYEVATFDPVTPEQVQALRDGVQLDDEPAPIAAHACEATGERSLRLALLQGKYHQVKRMVAAAGNHVTALHRSAIGGLRLDPALAPGEWRWLTPEDMVALKSAGD